jgi:hypothetical protein
MKTLLLFFVALLVLELTMYGVASASYAHNAIFYFPIIPAIWIAMIIGGVHSAGFLSILVGLVITAFSYALVGWLVFAISSRFMRKKKRSSADPDLTLN